MEERKNSSGIWIAVTIACLAISAIFTTTVLRGELNQDEGWYLYGAGLISSGQAPYIDFATTQGPVMQYVYAAFWFLVERWGVLGGRILTAVFGAASIILSAATVWRMLKPSKRGLGVLTVLCLAGLNTYQIYFFSIVKTYALAAALLSGSFFLLTFPGRKHLWAFLAGIMMMLAVGTRMSAAAMIPAVMLGLLSAARQERNMKTDLRWLAYGVGTAICLGVMFIPFLLKAPEGVKFAMFGYHAGRVGGEGLISVAYKGGFIARLVQAYYPALVLLVGIAAFALGTGRTPEQGTNSIEKRRFAMMILGAVLLVTILHIAVPFPYDDYQTMVFPVFCAGLVMAGQRLLPEEGQRRAGAVILLAGLLFAGASPLNEKMFIGKRDRIWWPIRKETSLQKLRRAADYISERAGDRGKILTQDLYIAVEAGLKVPDGMELGPFCYFPDWPRDKAETLHVINDEMLREIISSSEADVAAFSEYGLAIRAPEILPNISKSELLTLVEVNYAPAAKIADFGQAETELTILIRKK